MSEETDPRYIRAIAHAETIIKLANQLDTAITVASKDGYHATIRIESAVRLSDGVFIGHGDKSMRITATVALDLIEAVR